MRFITRALSINLIVNSKTSSQSRALNVVEVLLFTMRFIDRALENGDVFHTRMRFMVRDEVYDQGPNGK